METSFPFHEIVTRWTSSTEIGIDSDLIDCEVLQLCVEHYPDAAKDNNGLDMLPLHCALAAQAPEEVIMFLLDKYPQGARVIAPSGQVPLFLALSRPRIFHQLVRIYPGGVSMANRHGCLPLHCACSSYRAHLEVIQFLVEQYPAAVRQRDLILQLPLHFAASRRDNIVGQYMIEQYSAATHEVDAEGNLPLHNACNVEHGRPSERSTIDTLRLFLDEYPEGVNVVNDAGMLPLHLACSHPFGDNFERICLLLDVDPWTVLQPNGDGKTPLQLSFDGWMHTRQSFPTRKLLLEKQDEAVRLLRESLEPTIEHCRLPDLVVAEIWAFVFPTLRRPSQEEMNE